MFEHLCNSCSNEYSCPAVKFGGELVMTCSDYDGEWEKVEEREGLKHDDGKLDWYALPLEILEPLADLMSKVGEPRYGLFNCMKPFSDANRRFYNGIMRHMRACQEDPLAKDATNDDCYHLASIAFNALMRLHHCRQNEVKK